MSHRVTTIKRQKKKQRNVSLPLQQKLSTQKLRNHPMRKIKATNLNNNPNIIKSASSIRLPPSSQSKPKPRNNNTKPQNGGKKKTTKLKSKKQQGGFTKGVVLFPDSNYSKV